MKVSITDQTGITLRTAPQVTLDMSVEEFVALEALRWHGLTGHGDLRARIDTAFHEALNALPDYWETRVRRAAQRVGRRLDTQDIAKEIRRR